MNKKKENTENNFSSKKAAAYSISQLINTASFQTFSLLVFTFYFAVIGINVILISIGFFIWSFWNSINDPLLGYFSDRTHTRWGRRYPYIIVSIIPLAIIMILLFCPPMTIGITDEIINFLYFVIIIIVFELFFTMLDLNLISLFPELFITEEERAKANAIRLSFYIVGLLIAFVLPTLFIPDLTDSKYLPEYQFFGVINAIIIIAIGAIFLKVTPKEKAEFKDEYKKSSSFIVSIKTCGKNKTFMYYIPTEVAIWFVIGIHTTLVPLYGKFVLGIGEGESFFLALLLGLTFISAAIFMNILWKPLVQKIGPRKSFLISLFTWILTIIPLMFIIDKWQGIIVFFIIGIGLSGPIYFVDLILADIIDDDEVNTKTRSEASYYGVKMFFLRLATVFVFLAIGTVFTNVGWAIYEPESVTVEVILGLRTLMCILPIIAISIAFLTVYRYPLDGERLKKIKEELKVIHAEKKSRI
ncbi:MAG: MFS transporter [Promethearchaeota archaeon]